MNMQENMLDFLKQQTKNLLKGGLFYNDNLWLVSYVIGCLVTLSAILDEYNVSTVSDTNPIAMALAGGFYLFCSVAVGCMYLNFKCMRIGIVEAIYMVLKVLGFDFDNFGMSLLLRVYCIVGCFCLSHIILRPIYKKCKEDSVLDSLCLSGILMAIISIVVYIIVNRVKIGLMIGGGMVLFFVFKFWGMMGGGMEVDGVSYGNGGNSVSGGSSASSGSDSVGNGISTSSNQSERIAFSNYDFSRGDFAKDFNKIDF